MMCSAAALNKFVGGGCSRTGDERILLAPPWIGVRDGLGLVFTGVFVADVERRLFLASTNWSQIALDLVLPFLEVGDFPDGELSCWCLRFTGVVFSVVLVLSPHLL